MTFACRAICLLVNDEWNNDSASGLVWLYFSRSQHVWIRLQPNKHSEGTGSNLKLALPHSRGARQWREKKIRATNSIYIIYKLNVHQCQKQEGCQPEVRQEDLWASASCQWGNVVSVCRWRAVLAVAWLGGRELYEKSVTAWNGINQRRTETLNPTVFFVLLYDYFSGCQWNRDNQLKAKPSRTND